MRVLPEAEKIKGSYKTVATIKLSILNLAEKRKFQVVNATDPSENHGQAHALGQVFESSSGKQFSLIQQTQAPKPYNNDTNIVLAWSNVGVVKKDLEVILKDLGLKRTQLRWVLPILKM